jgi:hypothetical protein
MVLLAIDQAVGNMMLSATSQAVVSIVFGLSGLLAVVLIVVRRVLAGCVVGSWERQSALGSAVVSIVVVDDIGVIEFQ